jgi:hypothetical protein
MTQKVLTKAQRVARAQERAEEAICELFTAVEQYQGSPHQRRFVMSRARYYARSMDALSRVRAHRKTGGGDE